MLFLGVDRVQSQNSKRISGTDFELFLKYTTFRSFFVWENLLKRFYLTLHESQYLIEVTQEGEDFEKKRH